MQNQITIKTLSDSTLVENLEHTKKTAAEIELKVMESKKTSSEIDKVIPPTEPR